MNTGHLFLRLNAIVANVIDRAKIRPAPVSVDALICKHIEVGPVSQNMIGITPKQQPPSATNIRTMLSNRNNIFRTFFSSCTMSLLFTFPDIGWQSAWTKTEKAQPVFGKNLIAITALAAIGSDPFRSSRHFASLRIGKKLVNLMPISYAGSLFLLYLG